MDALVPGARRHGWLLTAAGVALASFVALGLAIAVGSPEIHSIDVAIRGWMLSVQRPETVDLVRAVTMLGSLTLVAAFAFAAAALSMGRVPRRVCSAVPVLAFVASFGAVNIAKAVVAKPRPGVDLTGVLSQSDLSFPSGHTTNSGVVLVVSVLVLHRAGVLPRRVLPATLAAVLIGVLLIGYTRVYLGEHWPTDVVGGWLLATTLVCAVEAIMRCEDLHASGARRASGGEGGV